MGAWVATIEVKTEENIVGGDWFATEGEGYAEMRRHYAAQWPHRADRLLLAVAPAGRGAPAACVPAKLIAH